MESLFLMEPEAMMAALATEEDRLTKAGADPTTVRAYVLTAPLLLENEAISRYLQQSNQHFLRNSLPELTTVNEAISLAIAEFRLKVSQTRMLRTLLEQALQTD